MVGHFGPDGTGIYALSIYLVGHFGPDGTGILVMVLVLQERCLEVLVL